MSACELIPHQNRTEMTSPPEGCTPLGFVKFYHMSMGETMVHKLILAHFVKFYHMSMGETMVHKLILAQ